MFKFFVIIFLFLIVTINPISGEPFSDVREDGWATEAVRMLEEKGLIEGYPDGLFKGDRPAGRYEVAMAVARLIAKIEQLEASVPEKPDLSGFITQKDLEIINILIEEYESELTSMGVRVNNLEDTLVKLTSRIEEMERVQISGELKSCFISNGFYPGENNRSGLGTPVVNTENIPGPTVKPSYIRYFYGFYLTEGSALASELQLNVKVKLHEKLKAGGLFKAYSSFGEDGLLDGAFIPPYNPLGPAYLLGENFQANLATLWFDSDGDWDFTGKFGEHTVNNVSENLFVGPRSLYVYGGALKLPLNGINFTGKLYDKVNLEIFTARNINSYLNFNYPLSCNPNNPENALYCYGTRLYIVSNWSWYPLAVPYNDGAGATHQFSYGRVSSGQYDNSLYGIWSSFDFNDGKGHIEGSYIRLFEDFASNPNVATAGSVPKGLNYYGVNCYYKLFDNKLKISSNFNCTSFDYNLLDKTRESVRGYLFDLQADMDFERIKTSAKFFYVEPNYDPFSYHKVWEKQYLDWHHLGSGWTTWKYGVFANGTRFGEEAPNRIGVDCGMDWFFGEEKEGQVYGNVVFMWQVEPTAITADDKSFQKYDFLTGLPVADTVGAGIYGNQDLHFVVDDPARGRLFNLDIGAKYEWSDFYVWAMYERYEYMRDFDLVHLNSQGEAYNMDYTVSYFYTGLTYDVTDKLSLQGSFGYTRVEGMLEQGYRIDNTELLPGAGMMYAFSQNCNFIVDYKLAFYSDEIARGSTDYKASIVASKLQIKF